MERLTAELREQTAEAAKLDKLIWANLEDIGYGEVTWQIVRVGELADCVSFRDGHVNPWQGTANTS